MNMWPILNAATATQIQYQGKFSWVTYDKVQDGSRLIVLTPTVEKLHRPLAQIPLCTWIRGQYVGTFTF